MVVLNRPVQWFTLSPQQARDLAKLLGVKAEEIEGK